MLRRLYFISALIIIAAVSLGFPKVVEAASNPIRNGVKPYPMPELQGVTQWLNSQPLTKASLKGKVVLIDFWTYSCINCLRAMPYIHEWYQSYHDKGFEVVSVHTPEFPFEGEVANVQKAIKKYKVPYAVAMDNDYHIWEAFNNHYWPAHYLVNQDGQIVYTHFGEGDYEITEGNIRALLAMGAMDNQSGDKLAKVPYDVSQTPETYLGFARARGEVSSPDFTAKLDLNRWQISQNWLRKEDYLESTGPKAKLRLNFRARKVFLVMESADGKPHEVAIETSKGVNQKFSVTDALLYQLVDLGKLDNAILTLTSEDSGLRIYAFTFES